VDSALITALIATSIALSIASLIIAARAAKQTFTTPRRIHAVASRRRAKRVKRYVLLKVVCLDGAPPDEFARELTSKLYSALGPVLAAKCGIALAAFRKDLGRAIIRVSGDPRCVSHVLLALSTLHVLENSRCLAIPLRTSGCLTRLRKALRVYRASG